MNVIRPASINNFLSLLCVFALATFFGVPAAVAQEVAAVAQQGMEQHTVSQGDIDRLNAVKKAASNQRVDANIEVNKTGTDPRDFSPKWMPYYRNTELENGMVQQDVTAFGSLPFNRTLGMFYEIPVAQYRDFSDVSGFDSEDDAIGLGDITLKFLWNPDALGFSYGKDGSMSGGVLLGTDYILPTATDDALAGDALLFAPIVGVVMDMPLHGFFAALNLYYFDVYKKDSAPDTSRYVGRFFYMQPLTPPGPWWGGIFVLPEFQPIYDFKTDDYSSWFGMEVGKMFAPGKIGYIKPGWGIDNSEVTDRDTTLEVGFRWFF
jgi:hypothetical protein